LGDGLARSIDLSKTVKNPSTELKTYRAELHLHTVLSPCAAVEMIPPLIIQEAEAKGINLIAVSDHNAIDNIEAVMQAAQGTSITVLPGIELQTREEIHSLCLFDRLEQIKTFFKQVKPTFPEIKNNIAYFGEQFVVDKTGDFIRREDRLLISSSNLSLEQAWRITNDNGGLLIPAHVNRPAFGLFAILGFIPQDIPLEIIEISRHITPSQAQLTYPQLSNYHIIQNGDAHQLEEIIGFNIFHIKEPSINEIILALRGSESRSYKNITESTLI
jgi:PHP family Zn ribbon phosphoesterase